MNSIGSIIQFMGFIILILVMAKVFGFADNGAAVIGVCVIGGGTYVVIYLISSKLRERKEFKKSTTAFKNKKNPDTK